LTYLPSYRSCIALSKAALLVARMPAPGTLDDADDDGAVLPAGDGVVSAVEPDWRYEQPAAANATRRIPERII
jgi:hypothetical protein